MSAMLYFVLVLLPLVLGNSLDAERYSGDYKHVCETIAPSISSESAVFYPGSKSYDSDIFHWAITSSQRSDCTVEPGNANDVGKILQILDKFRTPFAVKSGGHIMNPGFSSTPGVQIAMTRFNDVVYDSSTETVEFGSGLVFDEVYDALAPYNRSVAGGRIAGIGVGGFLLGGGYSWKANQVGLGLDTIINYELVKPDGRMFKVNRLSDAELFFGLKGGFNNFGIVTRFTLNALPQPAVWAGTIIYPSSSVPDVTAAIIKFSANNRDPRANIECTYQFSNGSISVMNLLFYDGPSPPSGLFDDFLSISSKSSDVDTRKLTDFISSVNSNSVAGLRGVFHTVPLLKNSPKVMAAIQNETSFWGQVLSEKGGFVAYTVEPFLPSMLSHNTTPTAYPPTRDHVYLPFTIFFAWQNAIYDGHFYDAIRQSAECIRHVAIQDGQDIRDAPLYPNDAIFDTPLRDMYGANLDKLRSLRQRVDPHNVMGLTGGFRF